MPPVEGQQTSQILPLNALWLAPWTVEGIIRIAEQAQPTLNCSRALIFLKPGSAGWIASIPDDA